MAAAVCVLLLLCFVVLRTGSTELSAAHHRKLGGHIVQASGATVCFQFGVLSVGVKAERRHSTVSVAAHVRYQIPRSSTTTWDWCMIRDYLLHYSTHAVVGTAWPLCTQVMDADEANIVIHTEDDADIAGIDGQHEDVVSSGLSEDDLPKRPVLTDSNTRQTLPTPQGFYALVWLPSIAYACSASRRMCVCFDHLKLRATYGGCHGLCVGCRAP